MAATPRRRPRARAGSLRPLSAHRGVQPIINRRQFGFKDLVWPTEYRYPDETYVTERDLDVGGTTFHLRHEKGETDDHTVTWIPRAKVLCCGDLFIWASPNAGNPQKVQRYPAEWAAALRRMAALEPEVLLPGHGLPVVGADRVRAALTDTARYLEHLVDQTLAMMNEGARLSEILHTVRPPADLEGCPYLQPVYDEPEFVVRNVWRLNGGWWDGNPATLKPAPDAALAERARRARRRCRRAVRPRPRAPRGRATTRRCGSRATSPSSPGSPRRRTPRSARSAGRSSPPAPRRRRRRCPRACSTGPRGSRWSIVLNYRAL